MYIIYASETGKIKKKQRLNKYNFFVFHHTQVEGIFYVNDHLKKLTYDELQHHTSSHGETGRERRKWLHVTNYYCCLLAGVGGFLPAVKQIANVAALPGIVGVSHYCATCMH